MEYIKKVAVIGGGPAGMMAAAAAAANGHQVMLFERVCPSHFGNEA